MSLSDLAALGSFISGLAVVFSFIFLALQMRQANLNQKSLMQQGRSARTVDLLMKMTDPILSETIMRAFQGGQAMNPAQNFAFYGFAAAIFWNYEDSFLQFQSKTLDAKSWEFDVATLKGLLRNPAYRAAWRAARDGIGEGYRDFVDSLMLEVKGAAPRAVAELLGQYMTEEMAKI